jgi:hypothetical protein
MAAAAAATVEEQVPKPVTRPDVPAGVPAGPGRQGHPCANLADVDITLRSVVEAECPCCTTGRGACLIRLLEQALADNTALC